MLSLALHSLALHLLDLQEEVLQRVHVYILVVDHKQHPLLYLLVVGNPLQLLEKSNQVGSLLRQNIVLVNYHYDGCDRLGVGQVELVKQLAVVGGWSGVRIPCRVAKQEFVTVGYLI